LIVELGTTLCKTLGCPRWDQSEIVATITPRKSQIESRWPATFGAL
jgi:hypothetical protein